MTPPRALAEGLSPPTGSPAGPIRSAAGRPGAGLAALVGVIGVGLIAGWVGACSPVGLAIGAGAKMVTMLEEERGFAGVIDDTVIQAALNERLFKTDEALFHAIDLTVRDGRVLLTGQVPDPEARRTALRLAWSVPGVTAVHNAVTVGAPGDVVAFGRDILLAQKMEVLLLFDPEVHSINYTIDVVDGTLYVMGIARSPAEQARVADHARSLPGVRRIVDHSHLIADRNRSGPPPLPPTAGQPPADGVANRTDSRIVRGQSRPLPDARPDSHAPSSPEPLLP